MLLSILTDGSVIPVNISSPFLSFLQFRVSAALLVSTVFITTLHFWKGKLLVGSCVVFLEVSSKLYLKTFTQAYILF